MQIAAYEHSVQQYHAGDTTSPPSPSSINTKSNTTSTTTSSAKPSFGFNTAIGTKDQFQLNRAIKIPSKEERNPLLVSDPKTKNIHSEEIAKSPSPLYATIDQAVKIRSGQKIQIRITKTGIYQGISIPANSIVYGICSIRNNRIQINVPSIQYQQVIIPTNMVAYDLDGLQGIYVDGSFNDITSDLINEGIRAGSTLGLNSNRNPLGNVSIKLGRKSNNRVSVYIPSGYPILLYDGTVTKTALSNELIQQSNPLRFDTY